MTRAVVATLILVASGCLAPDEASITALYLGPNGPPAWGAGDIQILDQQGQRTYPDNTITGTPYLMAGLGDPEGDEIILELELVPPERPFQGRATHTFSVTPAGGEFDGKKWGRIFAPVEGLAPGTYRGQAHIYDSRGSEGAFGWVRSESLSFTVISASR